MASVTGFQPEDDQRLKDLFAACDRNGSGSIEPEDLDSLCESLGLDRRSIDDIFKELDTTGSGVISYDEFRSGFANVQELLCGNSPPPGSPRGAVDRRRETFVRSESSSFEEDMQSFSDSCHARIADLSWSLRETPPSDTATGQQFDIVVYGLMKQLKQMDNEVHRLSDALRRANSTHNEHITQLQEEMDTHRSRAEETIRILAEQEHQAATSKQKETEKRLETEISSLRETLTNYKKLEDTILRERKSSEGAGSAFLKRQVEVLSSENSSLKNSVNDAVSGIAMLKAEMSKMNKKFEEQQEQIRREKEAAKNYQEEIEHLSAQLRAISDANRVLHDTSDDLKFALEKNRAAIKTLSRSTSPATSSVSRPSALSDEFSEMSAARRSRYGEVMRHFPDFYDETDSGRFSCAPSNEFIEDDVTSTVTDNILPEDSISMVNSREHHPPPIIEVKETPEYKYLSLDEELQIASPGVSHSVFDASPCIREESVESPPFTSRTVIETTGGRKCSVLPLGGHRQTARCDSNDTLNSEMSQETVVRNIPQDITFMKPAGSRGPSVITPESSVVLTPDLGYMTDRTESPNPVTYNANPSSVALREKLQPKPHLVHYREDETRQYRVVLAGDAAVGKTSFIQQICKGTFDNRVTSTLGVDFNKYSIDLDGKLNHLNIWDTAGQERFRALSKTYFRRADGAILLYDVTLEPSLLHVRDWVQTVREGAGREIPILICANKFDCVPECRRKNIPHCTPDQGRRVAAENNATFFEVSAKDGHNVLECVEVLTRQLQEAEDEERQNGLKLVNELPPPKDDKCSVCN